MRTTVMTFFLDILFPGFSHSTIECFFKTDFSQASRGHLAVTAFRGSIRLSFYFFSYVWPRRFGLRWSCSFVCFLWAGHGREMPRPKSSRISGWHIIAPKLGEVEKKKIV
ncbi:hypothetical protein BGX38DRAFT_780579 [Terfezia claveryi]|nr:hypothetical protein BGX38DRAFT_780579 [Terfezia claveryi]